VEFLQLLQYGVLLWSSYSSCNMVYCCGVLTAPALCAGF